MTNRSRVKGTAAECVKRIRTRCETQKAERDWHSLYHSLLGPRLGTSVRCPFCKETR